MGRTWSCVDTPSHRAPHVGSTRDVGVSPSALRLGGLDQMDVELVREIERLQVQLRVQEDPEDDGSLLPPLNTDPDAIGRDLQDALRDLLLARQQTKSLRDSLRKKEEQNELMRKVNEQVQTVQQKLVAKEAELTRTHEDSIRMSNELRALKSERATEQGQLEMLQWKVAQREREVHAKDSELKTKEGQLSELGVQQGLREAESNWKFTALCSTQKQGALRLLASVLRQSQSSVVGRILRSWILGMKLHKADKQHNGKMRRAKAKVEEQIKQVQAQ